MTEMSNSFHSDSSFCDTSLAIKKEKGWSESFSETLNQVFSTDDRFGDSAGQKSY